MMGMGEIFRSGGGDEGFVSDELPESRRLLIVIYSALEHSRPAAPLNNGVLALALSVCV